LSQDYGMNAWQRLCSSELVRCVELQASQRRRARAWKEAKNFLETPRTVPGGGGPRQVERVVLADLDLSGCDVTGFDFRRCYIIRVNLIDAVARRADFRQAMFRSCDFRGLDLAGADLSNASIAESVSNFNAIRLDDWTRFASIRAEDLPKGTSVDLINRIHKDNARYNKYGVRRSQVSRLFLKWTNYGRSAVAISGIALSVLLLGTVAHFGFLFDWAERDQVWPALASAVLLSAEAMLGIDASQPTSEPLWRTVFVLQTTASILVLALVVASITNKIMELSSDA
jgi:hypothetical protein